LDLYSLHASMDAVVRYLAKVDKTAAELARERYRCFDQFGGDTRSYGLAARAGLNENCARDVVAQLVELQQHRGEYLSRDGRTAEEALFSAEQNARLVKNAEAYYRAMFLEEVSSWNLRDQHMAETLDTLLQHLGRRSEQPKVVVWAHNSHVGDARATEMGRSGELNIGQLARERYSADAVSVGFTTHRGNVTAATFWDGATEHKQVRRALPGSYEALFHTLELPRFLLVLRPDAPATRALLDPLLERAIGVIYRPDTERFSHYFRATLPEQFDAVLHFDDTHAVEPLEKAGPWPRDEVPETFPFAV
jgi:erythromycin esterase-like protein